MQEKRDLDLIPGTKRSLGVGNGNPLQYSYLENSMVRGAWLATVHGVAKELEMTEQLSIKNNKCWSPCTYIREEKSAPLTLTNY